MAQDPNREVDDFVARVRESYERYERLSVAVDGGPDRLRLRKGLATDAAFRLGAQWELLQHRWHVAAISRDPSKLIADIESKLSRHESKLDPNLVEVFSVVVTHRPLSRLRLGDIERLVDPQDRNMSFTDMADWLRAANRDLSPEYIQPVSRLADNPESSSLLDLLKAMRNYLAHGSRESSRRLNQLASRRDGASAEGLTGSKNLPLMRFTYGIRDLGTYLNGDVGYPGTNRLGLLHDRVLELAATLRS